MKLRMRRRNAVLVGATAVAALALASTAYALSTITTVRATAAFETQPVHQFKPDTLAWTQKPSAGSPASSSSVWAQLDGHAAFKVNSNGSAVTGDVSGNVIVYQHISTTGESDIQFKNLLTRQVITRPSGLDAAGSQYRHPSMVGNMSNGWLLFDRHITATSNEQIVLYSFARHQSFVLASGVNAVLNPGQVNGPDANGRFYADWQQCQISCDVHAYRFSPSAWKQGTKYSPNHLEQARTRSGPGISQDGVLTFIEGTDTCGNAQIDKVPFNSPNAPTMVVALPANRDSNSTYVSRNPVNGRDFVYFHMAVCGGGDSDLYRTTL